MERIHQCQEHSTQDINHLSREAENCLERRLWRLILLRTSNDLYFRQHLRSTTTCLNFLWNLTGITITVEMSEIIKKNIYFRFEIKSLLRGWELYHIKYQSVDTDLHHVSNNQVWAGRYTEGVAVNDLCRHPAAVDEGLDSSASFDTGKGSLWCSLNVSSSPDGQLSPCVVRNVGRYCHSPTKWPQIQTIN